MPKRDLFQTAFDTMQKATGYAPKEAKRELKASAVKGGQVRASKLSPAKRKAIAKKAANTRWAR